MASAAIKGLTVEIGGDTTKLGKALEDVEKKSRNLSKELGEVNKLLKMDPGNADLLAQKQEILAEAVENTKKKLDTLKEAEAQVQEQFENGEVSVEQVRALQREIAATEQKLKGYERAVDETADEMARLGTEAHDAAEGVEDTGDEADDAEDEVEDLESSLDGLGGAFAVVAAAAGAAIAAIAGCVEASHEYRTALGKLETAFADNNHSAEAAYETYATLQGVLGETDQAVEAASHLALLADNEQDLAKMTDALTGVYATFGASLPIEGLTEAMNHTAKLGEVQGPLADALEWSGITTDAFNEALAKCNDEQERQELITETLTDLYGEAAAAYRKTNKQVIEANEANERWNKSMAKIGDTMAPIVTEVKNFGAEVLDSMAEPMEDVAKYIRAELLPRLRSIASWVQTNGPAIKATLVAVTAALVAYKVATIAAEVAQKGLKGAILATAAAEKALQLIQAATPWGLVATAVAAVTVGLYSYLSAVEKATPKVEYLTEAEREQIEASHEAAEAWKDQQKAMEESEKGIMSQMGYIEDLADEFLSLVGAHGQVAEADQARVDFIRGQLNDALGTEIQMVDGVILGYDDLKRKIYETIEAKKANMLLDANSAQYVEALQAREEAWQSLSNTERDYINTKEELTAKEQELAQKRLEYDTWVAEGYAFNNTWEAQERVEALAEMEEAVEAEKLKLEEKKTAYDAAAADYAGYTQQIMDYENAQTAVMEGNYQKAVDILAGKGATYEEFTGVVDDETAKVLAKLKQEAIDAGLAAADTKQKFEDGVEGYTEDMVKEAEAGYQSSMDAFATAYDDAVPVGEDIGSGLADGMENKRQSAISKVKSIVNGIIAAARKAADSHSPSRKMIDFGEDMGEGTEIGLENRAKNLLATARNQVNDLMSTYADAGEDIGQTAFTNVSRQTANREAQAYQSALNGNADKLDKILKAIERGQVLTIDGKQLVGHTAALYDNELGRRRALAARGAL
jgi:phage-related minor tail protein